MAWGERVTTHPLASPIIGGQRESPTDNASYAPKARVRLVRYALGPPAGGPIYRDLAGATGDPHGRWVYPAFLESCEREVLNAA